MKTLYCDECYSEIIYVKDNGHGCKAECSYCGKPYDEYLIDIDDEDESEDNA